MSPHIQVNMLRIYDVPHFCKYIREVLERDPNTKEETIKVPLKICQVGRMKERSAQGEEQEEIMKDSISCVWSRKCRGTLS